MVRDIEKFVGQMRVLGVPCTAIHDERWGRLIDITLPGGGALGVYEHAHALRLLCQPPNKQLQRNVKDKVPSHIRQRAAAELRR
jgi:hypothetical protein